MCANVERRPSASINVLSVGQKRFSMDASQPPERKPHTRVDDESEIEKKYSVGEVLGQGSFGVVREVTNKLTGQKFAMKIVNKERPGSSAIQLLEREVEVLKRVNHPHIIQLEEVFETAKKMYLIMELCRGGELSDLLRKKGYFREQEAKVIMQGLTEAVVYMHDNDMVHRDLKLENVLLSTEDSETEYNIKVTDFGLAHMRSLPGCDSHMVSRCGTLSYMAPEVLNTKHEYTKMCDVWSLGVIMYTLLCGRVPFQSDSAAKLEELILEGELKFTELEWINTSQGAKDLIKSMLCVDTTRRFTARRILADPWFTGQPARVMNALDLMRDMTLTEETSSTSNSLETVQEVIHNGQPHRAHPSPIKAPTKKGLSGRRAISMSTATAPVGNGNLKSPSTSAVTGKSVNSTLSPHSPGPAHSRNPRLRSYSVGAKLPKRPHTSCAKTRERKLS